MLMSVDASCTLSVLGVLHSAFSVKSSKYGTTHRATSHSWQ